MKILILCPGKIPVKKEDISCFTEVFNFFLPKAMENFASVSTAWIPKEDGQKLKKIFSEIDVANYDAILTLGLRFYSTISKETTNLIRSRFKGILCQVYDGSRLDNDPVDVTYTFRDDLKIYQHNINNRLSRHTRFNKYVGWAADSELCYPNQDNSTLRILIDHIAYDDKQLPDYSNFILSSVKEMISSGVWKTKFNNVIVRRLVSNSIEDVNFNDLKDNETYNRFSANFVDACKEYSKSHIFCVTHKESVGLTVLESAMAGSLPLIPEGLVPQDRINTVKAYVWNNTINWQDVLNNINVEESRKIAVLNSWETLAKNIVTDLEFRKMSKE